MKITIQIFTLYIIALSFIPCGDGGGGLVNLVNNYFDIKHSIVTEHEQHSNDCGDDACSPFCICSCCSSALDTPTKLPFKIKVHPLISARLNSFLPNIIHSSFQSSIWQPPKFS